jgi:predicted MFS family arabinose efflux permease
LLAFTATIAWLRRAKRTGREPLMNLDLFAYRTYRYGSLVAFIYGIALFGSTYLLPVYMQLGLQLPAAHVGTILLPSGIILAITIGIAGRLTTRLPTYLLVSVGLVLLAASFALMPTWDCTLPCGCWSPGPSWGASDWASSCPRSTWARCGRSTRR